jgi:hypothetical protein
MLEAYLEERRSFMRVVPILLYCDRLGGLPLSDSLASRLIRSGVVAAIDSTCSQGSAHFRAMPLQRLQFIELRTDGGTLVISAQLNNDYCSLVNEESVLHRSSLRLVRITLEPEYMRECGPALPDDPL